MIVTMLGYSHKIRKLKIFNFLVIWIELVYEYSKSVWIF